MWGFLNLCECLSSPLEKALLVFYRIKLSPLVNGATMREETAA